MKVEGEGTLWEEGGTVGRGFNRDWGESGGGLIGTKYLMYESVNETFYLFLQ